MVSQSSGFIEVRREDGYRSLGRVVELFPGYPMLTNQETGISKDPDREFFSHTEADEKTLGECFRSLGYIE